MSTNFDGVDSPGFQWISVGSGIEHAEGGGTPEGERCHGFQIWLRMPIAKMEDDPRYGTVAPSEIPVAKLDGGLVRVIAGKLADVVGPAKFSVNVQMLDVELEPGVEWTYECPQDMDNVIFYAFKGSAVLNGMESIKAQHACLFEVGKSRVAHIQSGKDGYRMMVFTGKMTKEKILWHGPFVCTSRKNLDDCFRQYQRGEFPPKRVPWDYKDARKIPK
eukprot:TRINITY_DN30238_c0_g2_i2.p1 TRINITY_DN30238_c0_g2~~TRINITY_DN30238_c0_g2_i2.p1  ORF type:complete len:248 (+),score=37.97 TRINITY_DN30238_c0_g2_i2:93-746(+)